MLTDTADFVLPPDALVRARLDFAQRCFTNVQELTRFMDQKAGSLISAVSLLNIALGIVVGQALRLPAGGSLTLLHLANVAVLAIYLVLAVIVIVLATSTFRALPNLLRQSTSAPGLMFPLILLKRVRVDAQAEEKRYLQTLRQVEAHDMLQDYANQIVEISAIYEVKQLRVNRAITLFHWLCLSWISTMLLSLVTLIMPA